MLETWHQCPRNYKARWLGYTSRPCICAFLACHRLSLSGCIPPSPLKLHCMSTAIVEVKSPVPSSTQITLYPQHTITEPVKQYPTLICTVDKFPILISFFLPPKKQMTPGTPSQTQSTSVSLVYHHEIVHLGHRQYPLSLQYLPSILNVSFKDPVPFCWKAFNIYYSSTEPQTSLQMVKM